MLTNFKRTQYAVLNYLSLPSVCLSCCSVFGGQAGFSFVVELTTIKHRKLIEAGDLFLRTLTLVLFAKVVHKSKRKVFPLLHFYCLHLNTMMFGSHQHDDSNDFAKKTVKFSILNSNKRVAPTTLSPSYKTQSWAEFHAQHHSDQFKNSCGNERLVQRMRQMFWRIRR